MKIGDFFKSFVLYGGLGQVGDATTSGYQPIFQQEQKNEKQKQKTKTKRENERKDLGIPVTLKLLSQANIHTMPCQRLPHKIECLNKQTNKQNRKRKSNR